MDSLSNEKSHEKAMAAHERFMARKKAYVMRNPSAVPVREREMILGDIQREGLRKHEMDMLDKRNAGMIAVAEKNAQGLRDQGLSVVEATNKYKIEHGNAHDEKMRKLDHEHALALAEKQRQSAIDLETQRGRNAKTVAETQNAGAEKVATIHGANEAAEAEKKRKHDLELENIRAKKDIAKARIEAQGRVDSAGARSAEMDIRRANNALTRYLDNPVNREAWAKMPEEEKKAWFSSRGLVDPRVDAE